MTTDTKIALSCAADIDPRASIHPSAKIAEGVSIGPWTVIGPQVEIGRGTQIASHVVIECNTRLGEDNTISSYVSLGAAPQDVNYQGEDTYLEIGNGNVIREFVTINRGSSTRRLTQIGDRNYFLAYSHVAHDCHLKDEILMVNHATLGGYVVVDRCVVLGAFTAVHQQCRIGAYSFLSRASEVSKDVPPFMLIKGLPGFPCGLNVVGLKRRGFSEKTLRHLKTAYQILYRRGLKLNEVLVALADLVKVCPEVQLILDSIRMSERGIARRAYGEE